MVDNNKHICDIATLGPEGTDSENAALAIIGSHSIPGRVILESSFNDAAGYAVKKGSYMLIPAAYIARDEEGKVADTWGRFHFRTINDLDLVTAVMLPLKEMCLAVNGLSKTEKSVALHPSTEELLPQYIRQMQKHYVNNKPLAARLCNDGVTDFCVASLDVVSEMPNLVVLDRFELKMIWALYKPRS